MPSRSGLEMGHGAVRPKWAAVGLGANLADPVRQIQQAVRALSSLAGSRLLTCSRFYGSRPQGVIGEHPDYVNAVALLETTLAPVELLDELLRLETRLGRERPYPLAPRRIDLDLLLLEEVIWNDQRLVLPHPRLHLRAFVLAPLLDVWPEAPVPGRGLASAWWPAVMRQEIWTLDAQMA